MHGVDEQPDPLVRHARRATFGGVALVSFCIAGAVLLSRRAVTNADAGTRIVRLEERRGNVRADAARADADADALARLMRAAESEPDPALREQAIVAVADLPGTAKDEARLRWLGDRLGPPTSAETAWAVVDSIARAARSHPPSRSTALAILRRAADDARLNEQVRDRARASLDDLEREPRR